MIPVEIFNAILSDKGFVILLKSKEDNSALPIYIGQVEAQSIIIALSETVPLRPLTHDLVKTILDELSCRVVRVEVNNLVNDTFYGRIILDRHGIPLELDARPSDAIALAVRTGCDIFVDERVMENAKVLLDDNNAADGSIGHTAMDAEKNRKVSIAELKHQLNEAVRLEQYEKAAVLRDKIRDTINTN